MQRLKEEGSQLVTNCHQLKMRAADGKNRLTDVTNTAQLSDRLKEKGGIVVKGKIHKKPTFEDKFDRKYACWVKNHPKAWHWYKVQNRKLFRRKVSQEEKE